MPFLRLQRLQTKIVECKTWRGLGARESQERVRWTEMLYSPRRDVMFEGRVMLLRLVRWWPADCRVAGVTDGRWSWPCPGSLQEWKPLIKPFLTGFLQNHENWLKFFLLPNIVILNLGFQQTRKCSTNAANHTFLMSNWAIFLRIIHQRLWYHHPSLGSWSLWIH